MAVTIKDIAERTGYTIATVSRALNSSDLVRQKTKEKIIRVAQEMGYIRNEVARGLATRQMPAVGIIIPDITNPYFPALVKGIQDTLVKAGYNTVLCNSDSLRENEMMHMKMLCEFRVKGIIMDPLSDDTYENVRENSAGMPIVFASNRPAGEDVNFVIIDNYNGAVKATKYLIGLGHKRIAFVGQRKPKYDVRCRIEGFRDTMTKFFGSINESFVVYCERPDRAGGYKAANSMILEAKIPTAIIACSDVIALGIAECFREHGFRIPHDVSLIGFDDIEYASLPGINLTTICEPRYEIGKIAAEILMDIFNSKNKNKSRQIILDPQLVVRKTCIKLPEHLQ